MSTDVPNATRADASSPGCSLPGPDFGLLFAQVESPQVREAIAAAYKKLDDAIVAAIKSREGKPFNPHIERTFFSLDTTAFLLPVEADVAGVERKTQEALDELAEALKSEA